MHNSMKPLRVLALASLATFPAISSASIIGFLGNFDVINDTGQTAHGFEIDLEGIHQSDISDVFGGPGRSFPSGRGFNPATSVERYGAPSITEYSNASGFGTKVTYFGINSGGSWDYGTPAVPVGKFATPGDNCWSGGGLGYNANTPCDHFGVGTRATPSKTTYSWLFDSPVSPGTLTNTNGQVSLPAPVWAIAPALPPPPGQQPAPPVVVAKVQAPAPILDPVDPQFGEALWVKVMTTELDQDVALEDLVGGSPIIRKAVTETEWQLLQTDPGNPDAGKLESGYGAPVGANAQSIIRRYEFYKYAGDYDPVDH
ncbi:MAG TPA: PEP-CTERM sorting domain-containing protein [Accumulibacter sp.]|nr:PEP-CTERM sorting domain-containing protein [Accumulibacter sp.]